FSCRAFLWQDGTLTELNNLVHGRNAPFLENANSINSYGQIAGKTTVQDTDLADAFLAIPNHGQFSHENIPPMKRPRGISPDKFRKRLLQRMGSRYQIPFREWQRSH